MMQNPKNRYFKSVGILLSSGISLIVALTAYIITALNGYYPDEEGKSMLYGNKDLLIIAMVSFLLLLLGGLLLIDVLKKKKTQENLFPIFLAIASAVFGLYLLSSILDPVFEKEAKVTFDLAYTVSIISAILAFASVLLNGIIIRSILRKEEGYRSYCFGIISIGCFILSVGLYASANGILLLKDDALIGAFYLAISFLEVLSTIPLLYGISDYRLR